MSSTDLTGRNTRDRTAGSTGAHDGPSAPERLRNSVKGGLVALLVLVIFVTIALFRREEPRPLDTAIKGPEDFYNLLRLTLTAMVACAAGAIIHRQTSSRPLVLALALGLLFVELDSTSIIESVAVPAGRLPSQEFLVRLSRAQQEGWPGMSPARRETMEQAAGGVMEGVAELTRQRRLLYCIYYASYLFWSFTIIYAGYMGRFAVDRLLDRAAPPGSASGEARSVEVYSESRESALYVAENAGIGLLAGIASGVTAIVLASFLAVWGPSGRGFVREIGLPELSERIRVSEWENTRHTGAGEPAGDWRAAGEGLMTETGTDRLRRLRFYAALLVITFFVTAYITALILRPRTSTWVACGAIVGVMMLPAVGVVMSHEPALFAWGFRLMELSPFMITGLAVSAALVGDWCGQEVLSRIRDKTSAPVMRPL